MGRYRAFLSYSHRDKRWGEWLHRKLESYRIPKKLVGRETSFGPIPQRLTPIFRDSDELAAADNLGDEITAALSDSQYLIVVCSPSAAGSRWVNEEIMTFKRLHGEGRVRALIVDGEPDSSDPEAECFPEAIRFKVDANGNATAERMEPIAADLRPGGDGKRLAVLKLVAGLTGASLDAIVQRETQRRQARLRIAVAGLSAIAIAFAAIAWEAARQRDTARTAQAEALSQRTAAVAARNEAEDLVEFMLTDLRSRLASVNRLDVLESVGARALAYYDARDLASADPDELGRRARAQLLVGEIENSRGDLEAARSAYRAAAATTAELLRRNPEDAQLIFDHSQSVFWMGYIAWQRGDIDAARHHFTEYHENARRLVEVEPDNDDYQAELEYSYSNLGTLELDEGNAAQAEAYFRRSLQVSSRLAGKHPHDIDRLLAEGQSRAWLADTLYRQVKLAAAREQREEEVELYRRILADQPRHAAVLRRVIIAGDALARLYLASNQIENGSNIAAEAAGRADALAGEEPENYNWKELQALTHGRVGQLRFFSGNFAEADFALDKAIAAAIQMVTRDASVARWKGKYLAEPSLFKARLALVLGRRPEAAELIHSILAGLEEIVGHEDAQANFVWRYCEALALKAELGQGGEEAWQLIIGYLQDIGPNGGPEARTLLAKAYLQSNRIADAGEIIRQLQSAGYQHPDFTDIVIRYPQLEAINGDGVQQTERIKQRRSAPNVTTGGN